MRRLLIHSFWPILLLVAGPAYAEWQPSVGSTLQYRNNVSNALSNPSVFSDAVATMHLDITQFATSKPGRTILYGARIDTQLFRETRGLDRLSLDLHAAWQVRMGLGSRAPRLTLATSVAREEYRRDIRDAWVTRASIMFEKRFFSEFMMRTFLEYERRDAQQSNATVQNPAFNLTVFDQQSRLLGISTDYTLINGSSLLLNYQYRNGDIDASAKPGSPLLGIARALAKDSGIGMGYVAYLIDVEAHTVGIDWSLPLGRDSAMVLGYAKTTAHSARGIRYDTDTIKLGVNRRL